MTCNPATLVMYEVSPGALQVQPVMMKKVIKLLSNLGLDGVFGKRRGEKTGQITVKLAALGAFSNGIGNRMFCTTETGKHNMQVQPNCFWMFLVISE
ncbi:TPA: hypothetical protein QIB60_000737 [Enterobacter cloacae subsp. dissolvens]|uniref:hypothetical protein n=1 Tax=Enterobacter cloacae TaxID=550 RepID=UPI00062C3C47|nr:hypothetical protein [Enterobacter cloacae]KKY86106.1 hypothetical protein OA44_02040 [Enterobacter cloacae]HDT0658134.1 hypothetical protein [Enterobacter cloacae subsp. dissolvens]